jgi:hypothetical protein
MNPNGLSFLHAFLSSASLLLATAVLHSMKIDIRRQMREICELSTAFLNYIPPLMFA